MQSTRSVRAATLPTAHTRAKRAQQLRARGPGRGVRASPTPSARPGTRLPARRGGASRPPLPPVHSLGGAGEARRAGRRGGGCADALCCGAAPTLSSPWRSRARAAAMSWELLLWLLALCALLALVVQVLRFLRADGDLTLMWAEWQGRRPGEDRQPRLQSGRLGSVRPSPLSPRPIGRRGASAPFPGAAGGGGKSRGPKASLPLCLSSGSARTCLVAKVRGRWNGRGALSAGSSPQARGDSAAACAAVPRHRASPLGLHESLLSRTGARFFDFLKLFPHPQL